MEKELAEYSELALTIELLVDAAQVRTKGLETRVELGSQCFVEARAPPSETVFIDIGFGFQCELTWDQALKYIERRRPLLEARIARLSAEAERVIAHIQQVYEGVAALTDRAAGGDVSALSQYEYEDGEEVSDGDDVVVDNMMAMRGRAGGVRETIDEGDEERELHAVLDRYEQAFR